MKIDVEGTEDEIWSTSQGMAGPKAAKRSFALNRTRFFGHVLDLVNHAAIPADAAR
jgi:hypothetical protein